MKEQAIKKFDDILCPKCGIKIMVGLQFTSAVVSASTPEQLDKIREEVKERLEEIKFANKEEKEATLAWADSISLDKTDIEDALKQVALVQIEKLKQNNEKKQPKKV